MKTTIFWLSSIGQQFRCSVLIFSCRDSSVKDCLDQFLKNVLCLENWLRLSKSGNTKKKTNPKTVLSGVDWPFLHHLCLKGRVCAILCSKVFSIRRMCLRMVVLFPFEERRQVERGQVSSLSSLNGKWREVSLATNPSVITPSESVGLARLEKATLHLTVASGHTQLASGFKEFPKPLGISEHEDSCQDLWVSWLIKM